MQYIYTSLGFVHWSSGRMICFIVKSIALFKRKFLKSRSSGGRRLMASTTSGWSSINKSSLRSPRTYTRRSKNLKCWLFCCLFLHTRALILDELSSQTLEVCWWELSGALRPFNALRRLEDLSFFYTNHMLSTLEFTSSRHWAPFLTAKPWPHSVFVSYYKINVAKQTLF